jgi:hypothetical protein
LFLARYWYICIIKAGRKRWLILRAKKMYRSFGKKMSERDTLEDEGVKGRKIFK